MAQRVAVSAGQERHCADETRTSFDPPKCPVVLVVGRAESGDALWERDLEGSVELA